MGAVPARARLALALAIALLVAGCSGGGSGPGPAPTQPANAIVIGLINTEDAPVGSFPDLRRGALAAARYVDDTYGGVEHRPIEIVPCATNGTPESSQACADRLLNRHPVAVIGGVDLGAAASLPRLQSAGVPYVGGTPVATDALTSDGSFMLTGGTATEVLGEVAYATDTLHVRSMGVVYVDVPGLLSTAVSLLRTIVTKKGVTQFKLVPVQTDAPDVVPALSAVDSAHPEAVLAVFPGQTCTRVIQGVAAIGLKARMMYPSLCAGEQMLSAAGGAGDGSVVASGYRPYTDSADPDVSVYLSAMRRYDASSKPSLLSQAGFSVVMDLRQLLGEVRGALTPQALTGVLHAAHEHPNFMAAPFTCDGKRIPLLRSLCNTDVQISVVRGSTLQPVGGWVDTAPVARLVG
jgi:branched-chain amino acid transport system substrate-binding protein